MIIYVYGSDSFKKEINDLLNHANIKLRLDENGKIVELGTLENLKNAIEDNPKNIYLIDDTKIIKKNSLNQKINFLKPKDGIEQEYLLDYGIGDLSVDSMDELAKHIIRKLEAEIYEKEANEIQDSIVEIVENAYEKDEEESNDKDFVQLDDELSALLSHKEEPKEPIIEEIDDLTSFMEEIDEKVPAFQELDDLSFDEDLANIIENKDVIKTGVDMSDEFSEFDNLSEADILEALGGFDASDMSTIQPQKKNTQTIASTTQSQSVNLGDASVNEIAKLISSLLNNKTLEITIKVKD